MNPFRLSVLLYQAREQSLILGSTFSFILGLTLTFQSVNFTNELYSGLRILEFYIEPSDSF